MFVVYGEENMKPLNTLCSENSVFGVLKRDKNILAAVL
jgi:hypothetical protein